MAVDVPRSVIKKLVIATFCMIALPLLTFFTSNSYISNSIISGGLAALAANAFLYMFNIQVYVYVCVYTSIRIYDDNDNK